MPDLSTTISTAISALGLSLGPAARKIDDTPTGYKSAHKRLTRYTKDLPKSIKLLEADLAILGLEITITPKKQSGND